MNTTRFAKLVSVGLLALPLFAMAGFLRIWALGQTALDVDEASNYAVAVSTYQTGIPSIRPELAHAAQPYLFHPPFGYQLTADWFHLLGGASILDARLLNVLVSLVVLALVCVFLARWGTGAALVGTMFIAFDAWIVLTNRSDYLENMQLVVLVAGMWLFASADATRRLRRYAFAGAVLGLAIIFKHIGVYVVLAVVANAALVRRDRKGYAYLFASMAAVIGVYLIGMWFAYGSIYFAQQGHELERFLGLVAAPGQNLGPGDVVGAIVDRYFIFVTTVIALTLGETLAVWRYLRQLAARSPASGARATVLLSWSIAGLVFAVVSQLKSPHYLILWLVPLYMYLAVEIVAWAKGRRAIAVPALATTFILVSLLVWNYRFVQVGGDSLRDSADYINGTLPAAAVIGTDPSLATLLKQPYVRIDVDPAPDRLSRIEYFEIYSSTTLTDARFSASVRTAIANCAPIATFSGFKDRVMICRVLPPASARP